MHLPPQKNVLPLALKRTKQTLDQRVVNAVESNICVAHLRESPNR